MTQLILDLITSFLLLAGAGFSLIAGLGVYRMPDLFTRMQAAAKTGTLGVGCTILAVAVHFGEIGVTVRAALIILFLFLTAPIAAHLIARAGYISGIQLWEGTVVDEMKGQYDIKTHKLASGGQSENKAPSRQEKNGGDDSTHHACT